MHRATHHPKCATCEVKIITTCRKELCLCDVRRDNLRAAKAQLTTPTGVIYKVSKLKVPYWMDSEYEGNLGTRRERIRIKRLAYALHGWEVEEYSDTTPSPPSSDHESDPQDTDETDSDSEPDTDEVLKEQTTARNSSTKEDMLDDAEDEATYPGPQYEDMRRLKQLLRDRALARAREREDQEEDTDPDHEGPGPATPRSPMRGLPLHQVQPPLHHHPPPGTPPATPQTAPAPVPGQTLRSGLQRDTIEEQQAKAQRMKEERQRRRQQAKLALDKPENA